MRSVSDEQVSALRRLKIKFKEEGFAIFAYKGGHPDEFVATNNGTECLCHLLMLTKVGVKSWQQPNTDVLQRIVSKVENAVLRQPFNDHSNILFAKGAPLD